MSDNGRSETYIDVVLKGRSLPALLDSGCERLNGLSVHVDCVVM